jgi:hypothetical protein
MKRTPKAKPKVVPVRNPFVALALKRKAGSHRKSNKAMRRLEKSSNGMQLKDSCSRLFSRSRGPRLLRSV